METSGRHAGGVGLRAGTTRATRRCARARDRRWPCARPRTARVPNCDLKPSNVDCPAKDGRGVKPSSDFWDLRAPATAVERIGGHGRIGWRRSQWTGGRVTIGYEAWSLRHRDPPQMLTGAIRWATSRNARREPPQPGAGRWSGRRSGETCPPARDRDVTRSMEREGRSGARAPPRVGRACARRALRHGRRRRGGEDGRTAALAAVRREKHARGFYWGAESRSTVPRAAARHAAPARSVGTSGAGKCVNGARTHVLLYILPAKSESRPHAHADCRSPVFPQSRE